MGAVGRPSHPVAARARTSISLLWITCGLVVGRWWAGCWGLGLRLFCEAGCAYRAAGAPLATCPGGWSGGLTQVTSGGQGAAPAERFRERVGSLSRLRGPWSNPRRLARKPHLDATERLRFSADASEKSARACGGSPRAGRAAWPQRGSCRDGEQFKHDQCGSTAAAAGGAAGAGERGADDGGAFAGAACGPEAVGV